MTTTDREPLLGVLKRTWEAMDPVPDGLVERVLVGLALADVDLEYELLTMVHRSQQLAGVRGGDADRLVLEFTAAGITLMLRVSPVDAGHRRIDGWVSGFPDARGNPAAPVQQLTAALWQEAPTAESPVGAHGRFEFPSVPKGLTRLDLLAAGSGATAFRTTLFEI